MLRDCWHHAQEHALKCMLVVTLAKVRTTKDMALVRLLGLWRKRLRMCLVYASHRIGETIAIIL